MSFLSILPTRGKLRGRRMSIPSECPFCGTEEESINHIFNECVFTASIWSTITHSCPNLLNSVHNIPDWVYYLWSNKSLFNKYFINPLEKATTYVGYLESPKQCHF